MRNADLIKKVDSTIFNNNMNDLMTSIVTSKVKQKFGFEYFINPESMSTDSIKEHNIRNTLFSIISKLENDIYIDSINGTDKILKGDFINLYKIDIGTFVFIARGIYFPNYIKASLSGDGSNNSMYLYIFGKKSYKYKKMIDQAIKKDSFINNKTILYTINSLDCKDKSDSVDCIYINSRDEESLVYSNNEMGIISDHIDKFISNKDFYNRKQLIYKTGILLHSEPGEGKSSIVKALATKYKRHICQINIGHISDINLNAVTNLINNDTYVNYIVLLEDIDTLYLDREADDGKTHNDIMNGLLQFLDSNSSPNNVIFVATTNHIDRLDKAMTRDGRFDLILQVNGLEKQDIPKLMKQLEYEGPVEEIIDEYNKDVNDKDHKYYNQSKLQNIIIKKKGYKFYEKEEQ